MGIPLRLKNNGEFFFFSTNKNLGEEEADYLEHLSRAGKEEETTSLGVLQPMANLATPQCLSSEPTLGF